MISPDSKPEAIVIGCGVSGLTSGIRLLAEGFRVKIITEEKPDEETSRITSRAAAAVWYPYSVDPGSDVMRWADITYQKLEKLASAPGNGVSFVKFVQVYKTKTEFKKDGGALWWVPLVRRFEHPAKNLPAGYECGYEAEVPLMDTSIYLKYLMDCFSGMGGEIEPKHKVNTVAELIGDYSLIVNCTGVWARDFCESELNEKERVRAKRGQVMRIPKIDAIKRCLVHIGKDEKGDVLTYIIPRRDDCLLGGTSEPVKVDESALAYDKEVAEAILERCKTLDSALQNFKLEDALEHKVGLRPARATVRLEVEMIGQSHVIHNYGHGGDGFTLSWGCAGDVAEFALKGLK